MTARERTAFGDWQTPRDLADAVVSRLARELDSRERPATIVEPTCGSGTLLAAAARRFPEAALLGFDIREDYVAQARAQLPAGARVEAADFFTVPWESVLHETRGPLLVIGNPPWVTSAELTTLGIDNAPRKANLKRLRGLDALTGQGNFDISEWMLLRLAEALASRPAVVAVLCKAAVARRLIQHGQRTGMPLSPLGMWRIDAKTHFAVTVESAFFVFRTATARTSRCPVFAGLTATSPEAIVDVIDGSLVADVGAYEETSGLAGTCEPQWRSGLKHDCSRVMELTRREGRWINGLGHDVDVESEYVFPFMKSSDVANERSGPARRIIVTQRHLGEDTHQLASSAPRLWRYLSSHAGLLAERRSAIYRDRPPFSIFGIGDYSFAPWKIAISGLYKRLAFTLVGPLDGKSVMVDDTCYFLPFWSEDAARRALDELTSERVRRFYSARIFWDAKRPINKALLQALDLGRLLEERAAAERAIPAELGDGPCSPRTDAAPPGPAIPELVPS